MAAPNSADRRGALNGRRQIQRFQVGIKAFVVRGDRILLVRERIDPQWWELPGGRIDVGEESIPQEQVLCRELREELGADFRVQVGLPFVTWVRPPHQGRKLFALLIGFRCAAKGGGIRLSDEHIEFRWVDRDSWRPLSLAPGYARALEEFWRRI